jgi:hypothetical protein
MSRTSSPSLLSIVYTATRARHVSYSPEAPVVEELAQLGYIDFHTIVDGPDSIRSARARIRYLAALMPDHSLHELAHEISGVLGSAHLTVADVRTILDGRSIGDSSRRTREVPIAAIQLVGRTLIDGGTRTDAARAAAVSQETVEAIDDFLGITRARADRHLDAAVAAVRDGVAVRDFAETVGLPRSTAHRLIARARVVLTELGEVA